MVSHQDSVKLINKTKPVLMGDHSLVLFCLRAAASRNSPRLWHSDSHSKDSCPFHPLSGTAGQLNCMFICLKMAPVPSICHNLQPIEDSMHIFRNPYSDIPLLTHETSSHDNSHPVKQWSHTSRVARWGEPRECTIALMGQSLNRPPSTERSNRSKSERDSSL